ncbi:MAG: DUF1501 domain-containing protein [Gemmatimonadales bacterium]
MTGDLSRRVFIKAGSLALVSFGLDPIFLTRSAYARAPQDGRKTLICVFQRGAVDGLNMVVPHGESDYYDVRPGIAVPGPGTAGGALDLDGHFGLHPSLIDLHPFYRDGSLAVVHAVGSPDPTRSHFDAQDYMETGVPGVRTARDGWINRHLAHDREHADTPFRGVAIGARLPRALRGEATTLAIQNLQSFGIQARGAVRDRLADAFEELYEGRQGIVAQSSEEAFDAVRMLRSATRPPIGDVAYPPNQFGRAMQQLGQLIKMDLGLEIGFVDVGGWDTHVNQGASEGQLANNLRNFGRTLAAFTRDLGERMSDVIVLTMSEFGRTIAENGNRGTDHGHGTAMFVMGGNVRGGRVVGNWPTLSPESRFQGRDLAVTTDFRDLFSEVLVGHLGAADLPAVFPGYLHNAGNWPRVLHA